MYDPKKPDKWGMRMWMLCESITGYALKIYEGKSSNVRPRDVVHLNNYRHRNHVVYFDAYFTFVLELMNKGFGVTCKPNR